MTDAHSFAPLLKIVHRFAVVIGVTVALAVPVTFAVQEYLGLVDRHRLSARLSADRVAIYAYTHGETWRYSADRVAELVIPSARVTDNPRQSVYDVEGNLVVSIGAPTSAPTRSQQWPIIVQDERVGFVDAEYSLLRWMGEVGVLTLLGGGLGLGAYLCVSLVPLRALRRLTGQLVSVEAELIKSHARLSEAIEAFPDAFALFDADDRLVMCNRRHFEIYDTCLATDPAIAIGMTFEEMLRKGVGAGQFPAAHGREEAWIRARVHEHKTFDGMIEQELSNSRWLRIVEHSTADGGRVGVRSDITELKQSEAERTRLRDQFHQAQQMQALGTLAGGVAHDFNNLLAIIIGHAELLDTATPGAPNWQKSVHEIMQASERGAELVKQILAYTRRDQTAVATIRLDEVIEEEFGLLRAVLPRTIELRYRTEPNAVLLGNRTQLHQVLMNLCVNASHAMGSKPGVIEIELHAINVGIGDPDTARLLKGGPLASSGTITPSADGMTLVSSVGKLTAGPHWRVTVGDNGCGMERAVLQRIFEPFYTTRDVGTGTGLGLAAVSGIVTGMGGAILVRTAPGRGSAFEIYLPAANGSVATSEAAAMPEAGHGQSRRVLFVDDEPGLVAIAEQIFKGAGYAVVGATDPLTALRLFRAEPGAWDLVVTDYTMPRMTGIDLAREIMAIRPDLPIITCTGYADAINEQDTEIANIRELLMKPTRRQALLAAVERALT
ncbi:MAG: response regulator [Alphaproteobacteria bacterium]|nr:response regulator [Alphaproteobacteria bacterium]